MTFARVIPDMLSLEYKRDYGCAIGETKLSDVVNDPALASEFRRLGLSLPEELLRLVLGDVSTLRNDIHDTLPLRSKSAQHLP